MDDNEVRVTDADTGAQKGSKSQRYDLIPWEAMDEVAMLYARGAEKYTKRGNCTCALAGSSSTPAGFAAAATTSGSGQRTPDMPSGSGPALTRTHREEQRQINAAGADLARAAITRRDERGKS